MAIVKTQSPHKIVYQTSKYPLFTLLCHIFSFVCSLFFENGVN